MILLVWLQVTWLQDPNTLSLLLCSSAEDFCIHGDKEASPSLDLWSNSASPRQWWGSSSFSWGAFCSLIGVCSLSRLTVGRGAGSFLSGSFSNQLSQSNLDDEEAMALTHVALEFPRIPCYSHAFVPLSFLLPWHNVGVQFLLCLLSSFDSQCGSLSGLWSVSLHCLYSFNTSLEIPFRSLWSRLCVLFDYWLSFISFYL